MTADKYILFAEDDEDDRYLFTSAFKEIAPSVDLVFVSNVVELKEHFLQYENCATTKLPSAVVLDIHIPIKTGDDTVQNVLGKDYAKAIPTVLLTSTTCELELMKEKELQCQVSFQKPKDNQTLLETLAAIKFIARL